MTTLDRVFSRLGLPTAPDLPALVFWSAEGRRPRERAAPFFVWEKPMDDIFAPTSVARDLLGLGSAASTSAPAPSSRSLLDFGGSWSITADTDTHSLAGASMAANTSGDGATELANMQPVETQLRGLANVSRYTARLDQSTLRVTLDLSWQSMRGASRSGRVEVAVTHGLADAAIADRPCALARPARLLHGTMYACNLLGAAVERAVTQEVQRQNAARDGYEREFGVPVASPALPDKAGTDLLARWSLTSPPKPRDYPLPGGDLPLFDAARSSGLLPRMDGASLSPPDFEKGLAEERERKELRRLGMAPIRELLAAPAGAPATEFRYHAGIVDVVYGRHRVRFVVNATTGGMVMDGRTRLTAHPARKVGDTVWVSSDVLDLAKAADEAATPFAFRARGFEGLDLLRGADSDSSDEPVPAYRAPDGLITSLVDAFSKGAPDNALSVALAHRWHSMETHMALARLEGRLVRPVRLWFAFNQPNMEFWAGAGDSLTAGATDVVRAAESWLLDAPSLDRSSYAFRAGVYTEMAAELGLAGSSAWLKSRAARLIAEYGSSGVVRSKIHGATAARLRREIAKALAEEAGHKVSFELHHIHPLFGHIGGQKALFPTAGLPAWMANSAWNMKPIIAGRAAHAAEHRAMAQMERWLAMGVNKQKTVARTSVAGIDYAADWLADADF